MRRSTVACLLLAAVAATCATPIAAGTPRRLLGNPVCAGLELVCSASCSAAGYSYYRYDCGRDKCGCTNSAVGRLGKCFPGSATVRLRGGERKTMAELALGDEVLTISHDGSLRYDKVRACVVTM